MIQVVAIQGSKSGDKFTVNIGLYLREVDRLFDDWMDRAGGGLGTDRVLKEELCWLRARIGGISDVPPEGGDLWWSYENFEAALADVDRRLQMDVSRALDASSPRRALLGWWDSPLPRTPTWRLEPRTPLGFALLLRDAGRTEAAAALVRQVWDGARGPFKNTVAFHAAELGLPVD